MLEGDVRRYLIEKLQPWGLLRPIENDAGVGFPDINFYFTEYHTEGWIEVKYVRSRPKRSTTPVFGEVFKPSQRIWLRQRVANGYKNAFVFIRLEDSFFCFRGALFREIETMTECQALDNCIWRLDSIHHSDHVSWRALYDMIILACVK